MHGPGPHSARLVFDRPFPGAVAGRPGAGAPETRIHPLPPVAEVALESLVAGFAAAEHLRLLGGVDALPEAVTVDLVLERLPFGEEAAAELRRLAGGFLRRVLEAEDAPSDEALEEGAEALRSAVARTVGTGRGGGVHGGAVTPGGRPRAERGRLLGQVEQLLRELALEQFDRDVAISPGRGGEGPRVLARPLSPAAAHVRLLGRLFARLDASLLGHELLDVEREASSWWFRSWSVEPAPEEAFARAVREWEWTLAERETLFMGPVLDNFLARGLARALPARQQRLAQALASSFAGVFVVREVGGAVAIFQDIETGRRIEVQEHDPSPAYAPEWIGLGRLYAFDGPSHLRSPGMALLEGPDEALAARLAEALRRGRRQFTPALALESLVSALLGGDDLPRKLPPARSPAEARRWLDRATAALADAGRIEETDEETPPPGRAPEAGNDPRPTLRYKVDVTVGQWLGALLEQSRQPPRARTGRARAGAKGGKRKRGR